MVFIADHLLAMGPTLKIGWIGIDNGRQSTIKEILSNSGISASILDIGFPSPKIKLDAIIVSNLHSNDENFESNVRLFRNTLKYICEDYHLHRDTKFIFTDVIQTRFEQFVRAYFNCAKTPYSARILAGKLKRTNNAWKIRFVRYPALYLLSSNISIHACISMIRLWLLKNRSDHPFVFQLARLFYKFLNIIGFLRLIGWN